MNKNTFCLLLAAVLLCAAILSGCNKAVPLSSSATTTSAASSKEENMDIEITSTVIKINVSVETQYPSTYVFTSKGQLESFIKDESENLGLEGYSKPNFADNAAQYTEDFFSSSALLVVIMEETSGSNQLVPESLSLSGDELNLSVKRIKPSGMGLANMAQMALCISMPKQYADYPVNVSVTE